MCLASNMQGFSFNRLMVFAAMRAYPKQATTYIDAKNYPELVKPLDDIAEPRGNKRGKMLSKIAVYKDLRVHSIQRDAEGKTCKRYEDMQMYDVGSSEEERKQWREETSVQPSVKSLITDEMRRRKRFLRSTLQSL